MIGFFKKLLLLSCVSCLYILEINPLSVALFVNILYHSEGCLFVLLMVSFAVQKLLSLTRFHFFVFISITLGDKLKKDIAAIYAKEYLVFSSKSFIVSSLTFLSLIHFKFIFVYGVRTCSNFILLHVAIQFSSTIY